MRVQKSMLPVAERFSTFDVPEGDEHRVGPPERAGWRLPGEGVARLATALVDRTLVRGMEQLFLWSDPPDCAGDVPARIAWHRRTYGNPELLACPDRYFRPPDPPRDLRIERLGSLPGGQRKRLTFTSTYRTFDETYQGVYDQFQGNERCLNHLYLHHAPGHPAILLIHPWCCGYMPMVERIYQARALYNAGLNVALFTLPFHGSRTPRQALFSGQLFPNRELQRTNEALGQTVADLRILLGWLRGEGRCGDAVGVGGMSLGGYAAALLAGLERDLAFAAVIMAPSSLADGLWQQGRNSPAKLEAEQAGFTLDDLRHIWAIHCPLVLPRVLPRERLLLAWSRGDHVIPRVHVRALWERWGEPEIHDYPGGHLMQLGWQRYMSDLRRWILAKV